MEAREGQGQRPADSSRPQRGPEVQVRNSVDVDERPDAEESAAGDLDRVGQIVRRH